MGRAGKAIEQQFANARYFSVWQPTGKPGIQSSPHPPQKELEIPPMEDSKRKLIWHGMFLFLLGLLTGFVETKFTNQRMALAAHLEGIMNGTFLVALGAVWMEVRLSDKLKAVG